MFTKKPAATRTGDNIAIEFAVSRETDVAVYVENAKGEIVRHLVAGCLGKNPPEPLKADSLEQTLVWDGKDDIGGKADGGPFKVRVGLGLKASWGGKAFTDKPGPNFLEGVMGLATGPDGRLYVLDRCRGVLYWGGTKMHVFLRSGAYERTIKPFPANLPMERVKATGAFVNSFGYLNPVNYRVTGFNFYPREELGFPASFRAQQPAVLPDGRILITTASAALATIDTEGGTPQSPYAGPELAKDAGWTSLCAFLAPSGDGKAVYLTGLCSSANGKPWHAVCRSKLPERGPAETFFGDPAKAGDDNGHLSDPRGLATDGKGHLLVADFGNNRVVALNEGNKSFAGSFPVKAPNGLAVHPATGAVYVCSGNGTIVKYSGWQDAKEQARLDVNGRLSRAGEHYSSQSAWKGALLAVDASAEPAVLWIGCGPELLRAEDRGTSFSDLLPADYHRGGSGGRPTADPTKRLVGSRIGGQVGIIDEATGQYRIVEAELGEGVQPRLGPDGTVYSCSHQGGVFWTAKDATGKSVRKRLPHWAGSTGTTAWERDFSVDRRGDIYVKRSGPAYHGLMTVEHFDRSGDFKGTVILSVTDGMYGPRVDAKGNLYIMEGVKPVGEPYPAEIAANASTADSKIWNDWMYGSIVKFPPAGGAVWYPGAGDHEKIRDIEGWQPWWTGEAIVRGMRASGGNLEGTLLVNYFRMYLPPIKLDAAKYNKFVFRMKNESAAKEASLLYHQDPDAVPRQEKKIAIQPNSDFTEYTFDMAGEAAWKGTVCDFELVPCPGAAKGSFKIDWARFEGPGGKVEWLFDKDDGPEQYMKRLPATMKQEKAIGCGARKEAVVQGALWMRPGFSPVGDLAAGGACHCTGSDFDVDDFGRVFAPDTGRFRVGVLDTNGNEILSIGGYGTQDFCGPDSYVMDPQGKFLRPRRPSDPKDLVSPFAQPEIAFGWIMGLAVTDRHIYVYDPVINGRTLRVKLDYAATETVAAP
jgi:hypothetical protein